MKNPKLARNIVALATALSFVAIAPGAASVSAGDGDFASIVPACWEGEDESIEECWYYLEYGVRGENGCPGLILFNPPRDPDPVVVEYQEELGAGAGTNRGQSPHPDSVAFAFVTAMSHSSRVTGNIISNPSNDVTADSIMSDIQAGLPSVINAAWSSSNPLVIVPATNDTAGSISGILRITAVDRGAAIVFDITIPALGQ